MRLRKCHSGCSGYDLTPFGRSLETVRSLLISIIAAVWRIVLLNMPQERAKVNPHRHHSPLWILTMDSVARRSSAGSDVFGRDA